MGCDQWLWGLFYFDYFRFLSREPEMKDTMKTILTGIVKTVHPEYLDPDFKRPTKSCTA